MILRLIANWLEDVFAWVLSFFPAIADGFGGFVLEFSNSIEFIMLRIQFLDPVVPFYAFDFAITVFLFLTSVWVAQSLARIILWVLGRGK